MRKSEVFILKLIGKKVIIRDWTKEDLDSYRHWNTGTHLWMHFDGPYYPKMTPEQLEITINKISSNKEQKKRFVIAELESNLFIGTISWYWQSQESNWKSIGLTIYDENNWGKGFGYDSLKLWVSHLFQTDNKLIRLDLRTWSGHKGMIKLAQKLDFREEARFRKARVVNGKYYDSIGMGILKKDWKF